jgi:hypothetical protein
MRFFSLTARAFSFRIKTVNHSDVSDAGGTTSARLHDGALTADHSGTAA